MFAEVRRASWLHQAHDRLRASFGQEIPAKSPRRRSCTARDGRQQRRHRCQAQATAQAQRTACRGSEGLHRQPESSPGSSSGAQRRSRTAGSNGAAAEALAFATLLREGIPIRLTGQDTERGTFSHRHLVLHDAVTGEIEIPVCSGLEKATARHSRSTTRRFPEYSCVGFEYGYWTAAPEALVLWEAQFGDYRERRADDRRPVHLQRAREVAADLATDAAPATWVRGERPGALERATGALPPADGSGEPADREPDDRRAVLPPAPEAGARPGRPSPDRDDAERGFCG